MTNLDAEKLAQSASYAGLTHLPEWQVIEPTFVESGINSLVDTTRQAFQALIAGNEEPTWASLMEPLERIRRQLNAPYSRLNHLQSVCFQEPMKEVIEAVRPKVIELNTELGQSKPIYERLLQLNKDPNLSPTKRRIVEQKIKAMQRSGVHLEGERQERFQAIQQRLSEIGQKFQNNLVAEAKTVSLDVTDPNEVVGLPEALLAAAAENAQRAQRAQEAETTAKSAHKAPDAQQGPWSFSVSGANYLAILEGAESASLREKMYRLFKARGTSEAYDNRPILEETLKLRQERAELLGFDCVHDTK